jgi:hypothetical protein
MSRANDTDSLNMPGVIREEEDKLGAIRRDGLNG